MCVRALMNINMHFNLLLNVDNIPHTATYNLIYSNFYKHNIANMNVHSSEHKFAQRYPNLSTKLSTN